MKQTGATYQDTENEFKMNEPSLIDNWNITFLKEGMEGLETERWVPLSGKRNMKQPKQEKSQSRK